MFIFMITTNLTKLGDSYYFHVPKKFIDVYEMMNWLDDYDFEMQVLREGKTITYTRIKKEIGAEKQTKLDKFKNKKERKEDEKN